jgi:SAM-dependent methyltransferase
MSAVHMTPPKPVQRWQADDYAVKGRFVSELARPVLDLLAPRQGERILDLGCGDGVLTQEIAARGADVLGADLSEEVLAAAAAKGLKVQKVDGHALPFEDEFDAVFTNAALHWMRRPEHVIAGVHRALRPHGRIWRPWKCGGLSPRQSAPSGRFMAAIWTKSPPGSFPPSPNIAGCSSRAALR